MTDYHPYFKSLNPPASIAEVLEAEKEMGFSIPTPYREFLLANDGGYLVNDKEYFQIRFGNRLYDDGITKLEGVFDLKGFVSMTKEIDRTDNVYYFYREMVGITVTNLGGYICMGYLPENYGQIFWVNHTAYVGTLDHIWPFKLADSLEDFLAMLFSLDELE